MEIPLTLMRRNDINLIHLLKQPRQREDEEKDLHLPFSKQPPTTRRHYNLKADVQILLWRNRCLILGVGGVQGGSVRRGDLKT